MLDKQVQDALNNQINHELQAAYAYLAMSAFCDEKSLPGMASWLKTQHQEEMEHAMRLFDYVHDRDGNVALEAVEKPRMDFKTILEVFEYAFELEKKNTAAVNLVMDVAMKTNDYATQSALKWFVDEQVEEEKITGEVAAWVRMAGSNDAAMLMLNRQLADRGRGGGAGGHGH